MTDRDHKPPEHHQPPSNMGTTSGFGHNEAPAHLSDIHPTDTHIHEEIRTLLVGNAQIGADNLAIDVQDGVVTLRGTVRDRGARQQAEDLVAILAGVSEVRNELRAREGDQRAVGAADDRE